MRCIPFPEFESRYPRDGVIGKGSYGAVYASGSSTVVKKQDWNGSAFIREVAILSQLSHPNICPVKAIAFDGDSGYIAMERGSNVFEEYRKGNLIIRDIISDLISAFAYLSFNSIAHNDLKIENIVVLDSRVVLIDFGFAEIADVYDDEDTTQNLAYSYPYRDPSHCEGLVNSIRCELYSIATTVYYLLRNKYSFGAERPYYITVDMFRKVGITDLDVLDFLMRCQAPLEERPSAIQLLSHPAVDQSRITVPTLSLPEDYRLRDHFDDEMMATVKKSILQLYQTAVNHDLHISVVCAAVDLLLRYYIKSPNSRNVSGAALFVAHYLYRDDELPLKSKDFHNVCSLFSVLDGQLLSRNQYNAIISPDGAAATMSMMTTLDYDSSKRYHMRPDDDIVSRKRNITMTKFEGAVFSRPKFVSDYARLSLPKPQEDVSNKILRLSFAQPEEQFLRIGIVATRDPAVLRNLNCLVSAAVFKLMLSNAMKSGSYEMLDRVVPFETRNISPYEVSSLCPAGSNIFGAVGIRPLRKSSPEPLTPEQFMEKLSRLAGDSSGVLENYRAIEKVPLIGSKIANFEVSASSPVAAVIEFLNFLRNTDTSVWKKYTSNYLEFPNIMEWVNSWFIRDSEQQFFLMVEIVEEMD
jgi:serine/threonine protein kinase